MCGIAASFGKSASAEDLRKSLSKITHRGQNLYELKTFPCATLGANRLAIIDRSRGNQPSANEKNTVFAVQNGEIFNYQELKSLLSKRGHRFNTDCDTEVLPHLWEEYGPALVSKIDSEMFAFVIYDNRRNEFFAARDPLGVKPLYYAFDNRGGFHLASEIKQLAQFNDIKTIKEFPAGHYFYRGSFTPYFELQTTNAEKNKQVAKHKLKKLIERAVEKRVQTDLPIGVFLSGGVDSSLVMELASRFHHNVTALILGAPGSSDAENAVRFCKERSFPYHLIYPNPDYAKELKELIYYLESYEPLIVRQAFANDLISRAAASLGLKVVLVGEGADELFAGYNEFAQLTEKNINRGCELLLKSLSKGHLMRVDKLAMRHTIEVRTPYLDTELVIYALSIDGRLKIVRDGQHRLTVKAILREVARDYLPDYIVNRYKAPFANGAGLDTGYNYRAEDGALARVAHQKMSDRDAEMIFKRVPQYHFSTREEAYYFSIYQLFGYQKLDEERRRLVIKDNLKDLEDAGEQTRMVIAEFDRLALYFPVYFAAERGYFKKHGLAVDFVATGGDDKTYASLVQSSAQIGMADPMFAMIDNPYTVKGEIIGELVKTAPIRAMSFKTDLRAKNVKELTDHMSQRADVHIGTYQPFSTTNTLSRYFFKHALVSAIHHSKIENSLYTGDVDLAVVLDEQADNLEKRGAQTLFDFRTAEPHFLFSGFAIAQTLETRYRKLVPKFLQAVHDALEEIIKNPERSLKVFKKEFNLSQPEKTFNAYLGAWNRGLKVKQADWDKALHVWRKLYPHLLHDINPFFIAKRKEELILEEFTKGRYARHDPHRIFDMEEVIRENVHNNVPVSLLGFWGASDKSSFNIHDERAIEQLETLNRSVKDIYAPGVHFTAILADEHARLNGYPPHRYGRYLKEVKKVLENRGWSCVFLSAIWKKYGLTDVIVRRALQKMPDGWWQKIPYRRKLETQAGHRASLTDAVEGAKQYYVMRLKEKSFLEKEFPHAIFFAYSDADFQDIYPNMPTLYLYSTKRNVGIPPWFIA